MHSLRECDRRGREGRKSREGDGTAEEEQKISVLGWVRRNFSHFWGQVRQKISDLIRSDLF